MANIKRTLDFKPQYEYGIETEHLYDNVFAGAHATVDITTNRMSESLCNFTCVYD